MEGSAIDFADLALALICALLVVIGTISTVGAWRNQERAFPVAYGTACAASLATCLWFTGTFGYLAMAAALGLVGVGFLRRPDLADD